VYPSRSYLYIARSSLSIVSYWGLLTTFSASAASAVTRYIPDSFPSIQAGINASATGDTVLVRPGTYFENIKIRSKDVVLRSVSGPGVTIIDGSQPDHPDSASVIHLFNVGTAGRVEGFTIQGGKGSLSLGALLGRRGGGIFIEGGAGQGAIIEGNWILHNTVVGSQLPREGGGICAYGSARILRNRIGFNSLIGNGGGIFFYHGGTLTRIMIENEIYGNVATSQVAYGEGGGCYIGRNVQFSRNIVALNQSEAEGGGLRIQAGAQSEVTLIEGNTVFANLSNSGSGGIWMIGSSSFPSLTMFANIVVYNQGGIQCQDNGGFDVAFECNDVIGNDPDLIGDCGIMLDEGTNFRADPLFGQVNIPYSPGDLCVQPDSPVLPENTPQGCGLVGARGECGFIGIKEAQETIRAFHAGASYPNPAVGITHIPFTLGDPVPVEATVYTVAGRTVRRLDTRTFARGAHDLEWDGRDASGEVVAPGIYVARIKAGSKETAILVVRTR